MADTLFVRLSETGAATWAAFDATGHIVGSIGRGALGAARAALAGRRCTVLVNGVDVLTAQVELPAASQTRLRQIAPFSLEESLADDLEHMAFAIGARLASGATQIAAVATERMDAWLAQLRAAGLAPQAVCSEADGVPDIPNTLVLVIEGARVSGRKPGKPPFTFDGLTLRQTLDIVLARKPDEPELKHVRVFADEAGVDHYRHEFAKLDSEFASAECKVASDGVFPHLAATLAQRPGTNLLQGPYATRSNWGPALKPWRRVAGLVAASVVLAFVLQGAQFLQLRRADAELTELVAGACQRVVGDSSTSGCQREVQQRLGASTGTTNEGFLSTLAAIAAARDAEMRIETLSYRNRAMDLQLIVPSVAKLAEFASAIEQTARFDVEIEATNPSDAGTEGRVRVVGAAP
ncbi:MAG TPA: type II secretion system protein GspL [Gammaproteobacteria bacterium]|nr:type II secretion system protein GspL [Gammaproteobacteria bacterium]